MQTLHQSFSSEHGFGIMIMFIILLLGIAWILGSWLLKEYGPREKK